MLLFHFSFSVLVCLLLEWNLPTASETVCTPSSAPPPNNLSAHVGLFQYFLSVQPIYYFFFVTYGVETQNRPIPSLNGPAPVPPAPRDGPSSRWLLRTGTGPAPAPPVQVPTRASVGCLRLVWTRKGAKSYSAHGVRKLFVASIRFRFRPILLPDASHGNGRARRLPPRAVLLSSGRRTPTWGRWPVAAQAALRRRARRCRLRPRAAAAA